MTDVRHTRLAFGDRGTGKSTAVRSLAAVLPADAVIFAHDLPVKGRERFAGRFIHPQHWPQDFDPSGKRILVIGSGATAFTLYDTYGFPLDLTQDALKSRGISVDQASFTDAMNRQREKARASWAGSGEAATETIWFPLREKLGATEFLGYETESAEGAVTALVKDGAEVDSLKAGESGAIVLNQTPFYAESGGQVGDIGDRKSVV